VDLVLNDDRLRAQGSLPAHQALVLDDDCLAIATVYALLEAFSASSPHCLVLLSTGLADINIVERILDAVVRPVGVEVSIDVGALPRDLGLPPLLLGGLARADALEVGRDLVSFALLDFLASLGRERDLLALSIRILTLFVWVGHWGDECLLVKDHLVLVP